VVHSTFYASATSDTNWRDPFSILIAISERLWLGVPMFFVISGYCIAATADSSRRKGASPRTYFAKRLRRIFPPYLVFLAISAVFVGAMDVAWPNLFADDNHGIARPWWLTARQWFGSITLTEGWLYHFTDSPRKFFQAHAWTLGYEEQFYAVTGGILVCSSRRFFLSASIVTAAVLAIMATPFNLNGFFFDGYWLHFAAGILVFYAVVYRQRRHHLWLAMPLVVGMIYCLAKPSELTTQAGTWRQHSLIAYAFAIGILWLHPWDHHIAASRATAPLHQCGIRCYSIYLVHWPICKAISHALFDSGIQSPMATVLVTVPLCLVASVSAGWVFHTVVERRFMNSPATEPSRARSELSVATISA
jgi:peptidoglycan/LPS O-acetylase OafA/YrhL